jgi:shikimate dehydrogenase
VTDQYAVFGNPIKHSKSPDIHRLFAEQTQQNLEYQKQLVEPDAFQHSIADFFTNGGKGLNITVPFKLEAFELADQLTERAKTAGAVNTLWRDDKGTLWGENTDGLGMVADITEQMGWQINGKRVLILGAGGAVRGVLQPVLEQQPASVLVANRTASKAVALADAFTGYGEISGCGFDAITGEFDLIINGTSASLAGDVPPIPTSALAADCACYDMMYGAEPTAFLRWAEQQGVTHRSDGLGMLVGQAAESFFIWRKVRPDVAATKQIMRAGLSLNS